MSKFNLMSYIMPPEDKMFFTLFQDSAEICKKSAALYDDILVNGLTPDRKESAFKNKKKSKLSFNITPQHDMPCTIFQTLNFIRLNRCSNLLGGDGRTTQTFACCAHCIIHRQCRICRHCRRGQICHRQRKFRIFICTYQLINPCLFTRIYYITNKRQIKIQ